MVKYSGEENYRLVLFKNFEFRIFFFSLSKVQ